MTDPRTFLFELPVAGRPEIYALPEEWYPGTRERWVSASSSRGTDPILGVRALVIHTTTGLTTEGAMSLMKSGAESWHWLVPGSTDPQHEKFVWACIPEARAAWHVDNGAANPAVNAGRMRANQWSLSLAIVNSPLAPTVDPFSGWQVMVAAEIVRYCWAKYPNLRHVVAHAALDPGHSDPGEHFPWSLFKDLSLAAGGKSVPPLVAAATPITRLP
jgi:N-acetyl-anhydromuramyl-L-alanine amidase AmpD